MRTLTLLFAISLAVKAQPAEIQQAWSVIERARAQYRTSRRCDDLGQGAAVLVLARANKLVHANLSSLCLTQIDLRDFNLSYANFSQSNLEGALLDKAHVGFAQFRNAQLAGSSFKGALIIQTSFAQANTNKACFFYDKPIRADEISELDQTWMGKNWRRWRDGKCTLTVSAGDPTCCDTSTVH